MPSACHFERSREIRGSRCVVTSSTLSITGSDSVLNLPWPLQSWRGRCSFCALAQKGTKTACLYEGSAPFRGDDDCTVRAYLPLVILSEAKKDERPGVWERVRRQAEPNFSLARIERSQNLAFRPARLFRPSRQSLMRQDSHPQV
jgi:hypothetical protein